jgi:hypothetical protein
MLTLSITEIGKQIKTVTAKMLKHLPSECILVLMCLSYNTQKT